MTCHKIYPYLLRGMAVTRPNQVWAMDITYIPMARGFVYLAVVLDWFSRRVLSWRLSITMEAAFCVETLEDALARHGKPHIFNTDQGSQFTGSAFTGVLIENGIAISMDGKGAWRDNVFVERLWRSVKYEEVYLKAYDSVSEGVLRKSEADCAVFPPFPSSPASPTTFDPPIWPFSSSFRHTPPVVITHPPLQLLRWSRSWSQSVDQPQDFLEQFPRHRDLGHLEDDVAAMAHDLGADLDELLPQARQRPLLDRLGQCQRPHEVAEIVGQRMKLKPDGAGGERAA